MSVLPRRGVEIRGAFAETPEGLSYGGLKGRAIVPGNPEGSRLYRKAARLEPHFMPVSAVMLDEEEIAVLRRPDGSNYGQALDPCPVDCVRG